MRGFLSLEPDGETLAGLVGTQNRLRDALTRQGVHFPERFGATLLAWPFASLDELDEAATLLGEFPVFETSLAGLHGAPNDDRPAEVGFALQGVEAIQTELFERLRRLLDPDPPKPAFVRLARIAPPSRKVGVALRGSGLIGSGVAPFGARGYALWRQTPEGFAIHRTIGGRGD